MNLDIRRTGSVLMNLASNVSDTEPYEIMFKWFHDNHPEQLHRWVESVSPNQVVCKRWLVDSLDNVQIPRNEDGKFNIEIVGGWYGFPLVNFLTEKFGEEINKITIFEADHSCASVIRRYTQVFGYEPINIINGDYFEYTDKRRSHMIINTSCEHMPTMNTGKKYLLSPERTLLVLQSNDMTELDEHINCVENGQELAAQAEIKELFGDYKKFSKGKGKENSYNRFMVMGKWK
jgi:hypothetical protein